MLDDLAAVISRHRSGLETITSVPRLSLVAADDPPPPQEVTYDPMVCFLAEGRKRVTVGERQWIAERGQMFLSAFNVPVTAVLEQAPYRCALMRLDTGIITDLLLEFDRNGRVASSRGEGQRVARMTDELAEAVTRWTRLLDTPADISPLAERLEAEVVYRLLQTPLGPSLRQFALEGSAMARVRSAVDWIHHHYSRTVRIDELADLAHMSPATLHRQFRAATGLSPLRFQQHVRLRAARHKLIAEGVTATEAARAVGYASPAQFNREYRRAYGRPPMQDAALLREGRGSHSSRG